jgi:hypothetical protein
VDFVDHLCVADRLGEPIWEPTAVDGCGRLWTAVDTVWRCTDQKVGVRVPPGVPMNPLQRKASEATEARGPSDVWEPFGARDEFGMGKASWPVIRPRGGC